MDPVQLDYVATSLTVIAALIDTFDADSNEDFQNRVLGRFPSGTTAGWVSSGLLRPATAYILTPDGTLYLLGAGVEDYGVLFASFVLSDPVVTTPGGYLVHPVAFTCAHGLDVLAGSLIAEGNVDTIILGGHSMGGAAAVIEAAFLKLGGWPTNKMVVITTGAPKPGDQRLKDAVADIPIVRWQNLYDPVPLIPPSVGLFAQILIPFPVSTVGAFVFGYKQVGGGRAIIPNPTHWFNEDFDLGLFNLVVIARWYFNKEFPWSQYHSLVTYQSLLQEVLAANTPGDVGVPPAGDSSPNKELVSAMAPPWMFVRIFGAMGEQGWSFNFYTSTGVYATALQYGLNVASAMVNAMHQDASIIAITASNPFVVGDSQDQVYNLPGQLGGPSIGSAHPNLAYRMMAKVNFTNRRVMWLHGLTNEMAKGTIAGTWAPTGSSNTAIQNFLVTLLNPTTHVGLITQGTGMFLRIIDPTVATLIGQILSITADTDGRAVLQFAANTGLVLANGLQINLKGRGTLGLLRGLQTVYSLPTPSSVKLNVLVPLNFVLVGKAFAWNTGYTFAQITQLGFDGIATHRVGAPFGRLRGRKSKKK